MKFKTLFTFFMLLIIAAGSFGCTSSKPNFDFPPDIKWACYDAKNKAESAINSKGVTLKEKKGCKVVKIKGTKKFGPMWAYYSNEWEQYIGGLCSGSYIEIACDPITGEIYFPVLMHEFGHYWLITNFYDFRHDPIYRDVFYNWYEPRDFLYRIYGKTFDLTDELSVKRHDVSKWFFAVDVQTNGTVIHIDFVDESQFQ